MIGWPSSSSYRQKIEERTHLCHLGKGLVLQVSMEYVEDNPPKVDKQGKSSVSKRMPGIISSRESTGNQNS
jgi:hypothetical protein